MKAARVLHGPVGVEEGVVAAVAEAETEILERESERGLLNASRSAGSRTKRHAAVAAVVKSRARGPSSSLTAPAS